MSDEPVNPEELRRKAGAEEPRGPETTTKLDPGLWVNVLGRGIVASARVAARAAIWTGRKAKESYLAIDPDVRQHLGELPLVSLTLLAPARTEARALPDDGHRVVIFVHGLGGKPGNFVAMDAYFRARGRKRTYAFALPSNGDLPELAEALRAYVAAVAAVNELEGGARIDVVAHSMGGLVARLALEDETTRARVATLVTMGTPHAGTHLARFGDTERTRSLRPGSPVLTRLEAQVPWRAPPRLVALHSDADMMLLPAAAACLDGAENVAINGLSHNGYLIHPEAWRRVFAKLGD
jgi:hypothetical protein